MATEALMTRGAPRHDPPRSSPHPEREARQRIDLGGVLIDRISTGSAIDRIRDFLRSGETHR